MTQQRNGVRLRSGRYLLVGGLQLGRTSPSFLARSWLRGVHCLRKLHGSFRSIQAIRSEAACNSFSRSSLPAPKKTKPAILNGKDTPIPWQLR